MKACFKHQFTFIIYQSIPILRGAGLGLRSRKQPDTDEAVKTIAAPTNGDGDPQL